MALDFPSDPDDGDEYDEFYWDDSAGIWRRQLTITELGDLNDVTITSPENSQFLGYNSSPPGWTNQTVNLDFSEDFSPRLSEETTTRTENYTIALADINKVVPMNGTSLSVTIPTNDSVAFPIGSVVVVYNINSTNVTVSNAGVTVRNVEPIRQFREASFRKRATNEWVMVGG